MCVCVCVCGGGGGSLNLSCLEHSHVGSLFTSEEQKRVGSSHITVYTSVKHTSLVCDDLQCYALCG